MQGLGDLPGGSFYSSAGGVSADGSVIVGFSDSKSSGQAFRWTSDGGMVALGDLPGGEVFSTAMGVSADGSVIVGASSSASGAEAFRWTSDGGMVGLGHLVPSGLFGSEAYDVSADGSVIVGSSNDIAFRWTAASGMERLWDVLLANGVNPAADGWTALGWALGISADGNTIVGHGTRNGIEAFVATLPQPAPDIVASAFEFNDLPHRIVTTFDQNVSGSLGTDDVLIENLTTQQTIPSSDFALAYDASTNTATFSYTGNASGINGVLPDGNYRATLLAAGITGPGGTPMAQDHILNFFFLNGDANRDARVNLQDFNVLAASFGQSGRTFSQGDFSYDGQVNLVDFNILASRFGAAIAPSARPVAEDGPDDEEEWPLV
jgi:probable HAF family extracellular repeat protein